MKQLFPPNIKTHTMKTRHSEHFEVFHAHTERLKQSPILYMQNLLNNEVERMKQEERQWSSGLV